LRYLLAAVLVHLLMFSLLVVAVLTANGGHFQYALDDAYIHMAVAKNFVLSGVWGITPYATTSSLSSVLWPWLLVGTYSLFGVNALSPLLLNLLLSLLLIGLAFLLLPPRRAFLFSLGASLLGSTLGLTFTGLEHILHALATLLLLALTADLLKVGRWSPLALFSVAALTTGARYEGMAAVLILSLYRLYRRDPLGATALLLGGAIPVVLYGLWSISAGWYFLPTSVLTKMYRFNLSSSAGLMDFLGLKAVRAALKEPALYSIVVASLWSLERGKFKGAALAGLAIILAQLQFGNVGWFYRYEAYAVILGLFILLLNASPPEGWFRRMAALALMLPLLLRGWKVLHGVPTASNEQFRQDYQMAMFVRRYYDGGVVVLNDVGNVAFYTEARILDLWGLATRETAEMLLEGRYTWERVDSLVRAKGGEIGILYGDVFAHRHFPIGWEEVGIWYLEDVKPLVVGSPALYFYAISEEPDTLRSRIVRYSRMELPPKVLWEVF